MRLTNSNRSGAGSGTCIDYDESAGDVLILSAAHIFYCPSEGINATGPAEVVLLDGAVLRGKLLGMLVDPADPYQPEQGDVCLLSAHVGHRVPTVALRESEPSPGSTVFKVGFPARTDAAREPGKGTLLAVEDTKLLCRMVVTPGDSGGGVFSSDGWTIGVVSGFRVRQPEISRCCCLQPIRRLLQKIGWQCHPQKQPPSPGAIVQWPKPTLPKIQEQPQTPSAPQADVFAKLDKAIADMNSMQAKIDSALKNLKDGHDGKDGLAGKDGDRGADGARGPVGPVGPTGAQGPVGVAGLNGKDGKPGRDGIDGKGADPAALNALAIRVANLEAKIGQWAPASPAPPTRRITVPFVDAGTETR